MKRELYDQVVKEHPYLWWWVKNKQNLSLESVVEGLLANGDMEDVERVFHIVGREQVKKIFLCRSQGRGITIGHKRLIFSKRFFLRMIEGVLNHGQMILAEKLLPEMENFYPAVGTALALQIGHRRSLDFDLASHKQIEVKDKILSELDELCRMISGFIKSLK